jgi:hypothetical protein
MFSIFPTISILDTLDRGGKDAYSSSSMVQSISRVPDALFDKSPPPPVFYAPPAPAPVAPAAIKASTISKPVAPVAPVTTVIKSSRASNKSKPDSKQPEAKKGKAGKLGKTVLATKNRSSSSKAGLVFPAGRLKRRLRETIPGIRVSKSTSVYLAAVL